MEKHIEKYYSDEYDLNCAEALLHAANDAYDLGLDPKAFKLAAGFGGGMNINGPCGALTGAVMALGVLYIKDRGHESDLVKELEKELFERYRDKMGDILCQPLKARHKTEEYKCLMVIKVAGEILADIVEREAHQRAL